MADEVKNEVPVQPVAEAPVAEGSSGGASLSDTLNHIVADEMDDDKDQNEILSHMAEDSADYREAMKDVKHEDTYFAASVGDHQVAYDGVLGHFTFDDRQFVLAKLERPADEYGPANEQHILKYIGEETDGKKIEIPEGLRDLTMTFAGTNIESAPRIPQGVEYGNCAFMDCHNLKDAKIELPSTMKNTACMFANCENLVNPPRRIPGSVQNADYMFFGDASMKRTPDVRNGVQSMNGMFVDCKNLKDAPSVPKSVRQSKDVTLNCTGIDAEKARQAQEQYEQGREKLEKKLSRKTIGQHMGSAVSGIIQYHYMRKLGYGLVGSALQVHKLRENNMMGRNFRDGIATIGIFHGGMVGQALSRGLQNSSMKKEARREERHREALAQFDRAHEAFAPLHDAGSALNRKLTKLASNGSKDVRNGVYERFPKMETIQQEQYIATRGFVGPLEAQMDLLRENSSSLDAQSKKGFANWFKEQLNRQAFYFTECEHEINTNPNLSDRRREASRVGLEEAKPMMMEPLVESMRQAQREYQLFNEGDQLDIDRVMKKLGLESVFKTEEQQHQHSLNNEFSGGYRLSPLEVRQPKADREATAEQPVAPKQDVPAAETMPKAEDVPKTENTPKPVKAVDLGPTVVNGVPLGQPTNASAPQADHSDIGPFTKPEGWSSKIFTAKHEERVRQAEEISSGIKTDGGKDKDKNGPEF